MDEKDLLISQYKKEIEILEEKIKQMSNDIKSLESLEFGWTGNLGRWYWNYEKNEVSFNYTIKKSPSSTGSGMN